jgi:hypothetical protein
MHGACRAMPHAISWLGDHYQLHALMSQLFSKLPRSAVDAAFAVIVERLSSLSDPRQAEDLTLVVEFACCARPRLAEERLLKPLVQRIVEDVGAEPADGALH